MVSLLFFLFLSLVAIMPANVIAESLAFSDVPPNAWFAVYVQQAADAGIVSGYKDANGNLTGLYGPSNSITVGELLKIASEGAGYDETANAQPGYTAWVDNYVFTGAAHGFNLEQWPGDWVWYRPAARVEVVAVLAKAFNVPVDLGESNAFLDIGGDMYFPEGDASFAYAAEINALARDGIISGDTDAAGNPTGMFRPTDKINRAEVAKMIMLMRAHYGTPGK